MNEQLLSEELLPVSAVAKSHPATRNLNPRTVVRWSLRGARGIRLETMNVGGQRMTSIAALERFLAAINAPDNSQAQALRSPFQRRSDSESAARELDAVGA